MSVENKTIQVRRDTSTNWSSNNPIPKAGEWCFETDTGVVKMGDGSTYYNSLVPLGKTNASTTELDILDGATLTTAELNKLAGLDTTKTELGYVHGVTSDVQTQIDSKFAKANIQTAFGSTLSDEKTASEKLIKNSLDDKQDVITLANGVLNAGVITSSNIVGVNNDGKVYSEPKTYADMLSAYYSKYDSSKFTVVGSPSIDTNGVMTNITYNDYVKLNGWLPANYNTLILHLGKYKFADFDHIQWFFYALKQENGVSSGLFMAIDTNQKTKWFAGSGVNTSDIANAQLGSITYSADDEIEFKLVFNGSKYTLYSSVNGAAWQTDSEVESSLKIDSTVTNIVIGNAISGNSEVTGSVDLKYFAIIPDGKPIYQGTKTGIDIINNDYEVVGSPAISNTGIVTGLSSANYIRTTKGLPANYETFEIYLGKYNFSSLQDDWLVSNSPTLDVHQGGFECRLNADSGNKIRIWLGTGAGDTWDIASGQDGSITHYANTNIELKLAFNGTKYTLSSSVNGAAWQTEVEVSSTAKIPANLPFCWGGESTPHAYTFDFSTFKIYADGKLSCVPYLQVPYVESDKGVKIADICYKYRAEDMNALYGVAPHILIDEENAQFILPYGSTDSRLGAKILVDSYSSGATSWEKYLDRTLIQRGSMTSGTAVVFTCSDAYADTNYTLSCPYSAKSTTGFTPSADGEFIAIGKY